MLKKPPMPHANIALFNLGFRPFFLGAGVFAILAMALWMGVYLFQLPLPITRISYFQWHAHEMIYGFSLAVIAGFLLTAVKNWTGIQTLHGFGLLTLFALWALPRILFLFGTRFILVAAMLDLVFVMALTGAVMTPVIKARQWRQTGIMAKLALFIVTSGFFYLGITGALPQGVYWSLYGGLYLIIGLILAMGRRVIPFFIEVGVGYPVKPFNAKWIDGSSLALYLAFFVVEVFMQVRWLSALLAAGLFIISSIRLIGWHTPGIWKKPLLWSLFIALLFIDLGFLLVALSRFLHLSPLPVIHAFSYGGIGLMTLSMMARVSLGHTGRNVQEPPRAMTLAFAALIIGALVRVFLPLIAPTYYLSWIALSQILWIMAFAIFTILYAPILIKPRVDGQFG
ncbi:MAG: NnrS family protein [Candidatus Competibacteraceae bacterium]|nr:NnrS family protein [Candidatus Competibacteraceae bacterium]